MSKREERQRAAQVVREQLARERRRRRALVTSAAAAAMLVVAALVGWYIFASQTPKSFAVPIGADSSAGALVVGTGATPVDLYLDFQCPNCQRYEQAAADTMNGLVTAKKITVRYHTVAILDRSSTNQYSTRSAAAASCASDGGKFVEYAKALYADQPPEGGAGHTDSKLIEIGRSVGLGDDFASCVQDGKYLTWVRHVTDQSEEQGLQGTPTIRVNGKDIAATPQALTAAVPST